MFSQVFFELRRDRYFRVLLLPFLTLLVFILWPKLSAETYKALVDNFVDPPVIAICVVASVAAGRRSQHLEERRFWGLLAAAFSIWIVVILLRLTWRQPGHTPESYLFTDTLYLVSYLAMFVAIEGRPHRAPGWSRHDPSSRLESLGAIIFVGTLLMYNVLVPGRLCPSPADSFVSPLAAYLSLDLLMLGRILHFRATCRSRRWKELYGWFAVALTFCAFNDLVEFVNYAVGSELPRGGLLDIVWYGPWISLLGFARAAVILPPDIDLGRELWDSRPPIRSSHLPQCSLIVYSFLVPILHFIWSAGGYLDPALREIREVVVLAGMLVLATLTIAQYVVLDRQNRALRDRLLETEENLNHARRMEAVGRLAGGVAHDFNNLLMVIRGYCEILQDEAPSAGAKRAVNNIVGAADRAVSLTKQLLAFSRKQVVAPKPMDLNAMLSAVDGFVRRLMGNHITVRMEPAPGLWAVCADSGQMEQVVMNLAANARDAMPKGGEFCLRTKNVKLRSEAVARLGLHQPGEYVCLEIVDTGIGMSEEIRRRVFEPFYTTKEKGKGTGLGLATVYAIVQQGRGAIELESAPGNGATFRIYLPRTLEPVVAETKISLDCTAQGSGTILLVEDEPPVRQLARAFLKECGYTVVEAASPLEAIQLARQATERIDLLVTDVIMPGMGGREMAEQLVAMQPDMKVLFISGHTDDAVMVHGVAEHSIEFLQKPFTRSSLLDRVRAVLNAN